MLDYLTMVLHTLARVYLMNVLTKQNKMQCLLHIMEKLHRIIVIVHQLQVTASSGINKITLITMHVDVD